MTISNNVHADQQAAQDPRDGPLKELASARFIPLSDRYFEHVRLRSLRRADVSYCLCRAVLTWFMPA